MAQGGGMIMGYKAITCVSKRLPAAWSRWSSRTATSCARTMAAWRSASRAKRRCRWTRCSANPPLAKRASYCVAVARAMPVVGLRAERFIKPGRRRGRASCSARSRRAPAYCADVRTDDGPPRRGKLGWPGMPARRRRLIRGQPRRWSPRSSSAGFAMRSAPDPSCRSERIARSWNAPQRPASRAADEILGQP